MFSTTKTFEISNQHAFVDELETYLLTDSTSSTKNQGKEKTGIFTGILSNIRFKLFQKPNAKYTRRPVIKIEGTIEPTKVTVKISPHNVVGWILNMLTTITLLFMISQGEVNPFLIGLLACVISGWTIIDIYYKEITSKETMHLFEQIANNNNK